MAPMHWSLKNFVLENILKVMEKLQESYRELLCTVHSDLPIVNIFHICINTPFLTLSQSFPELFAS